PGHLAPQQVRLIETAAPAPPPVKRDRHDRVEPLVARQRRGQKIGKRPRQGGDAPVLEKMNEFPQIAFVGSVAIRRVKTAKAAAAQSAAAFGIQRETVLEWCPATYTEILGA